MRSRDVPNCQKQSVWKQIDERLFDKNINIMSQQEKNKNDMTKLLTKLKKNYEIEGFLEEIDEIGDIFEKVEKLRNKKK